MGTLVAFSETRRSKGVKNRTLNYLLQVVRHILNLAVGDCIDERGLSCLPQALKIHLFPVVDARKPITWDEQDRLLSALPRHLRPMALFKVNTVCFRESEVCGLRWSHEVEIPQMGTSVFTIPHELVKNREDRLVGLNRIAAQVVNHKPGDHSTHVFSYTGNPVSRMAALASRKARVHVGLPDLRVHDLKHTFGRRLRATGVSFGDRQDLLGHKSARITTHYCRAELERLISAANTVCGDDSRKIPTLIVLRSRHMVGGRAIPW
ncbi:MAG: tyrosine-type recombinase/integrase [Desulfomonilaceae bacterium]